MIQLSSFHPMVLYDHDSFVCNTILTNNCTNILIAVAPICHNSAVLSVLIFWVPY
jgi:hypothetical protein